MFPYFRRRTRAGGVDGRGGEENRGGGGPVPVDGSNDVVEPVGDSVDDLVP